MNDWRKPKRYTHRMKNVERWIVDVKIDFKRLGAQCGKAERIPVSNRNVQFNHNRVEGNSGLIDVKVESMFLIYNSSEMPSFNICVHSVHCTAVRSAHIQIYNIFRMHAASNCLLCISLYAYIVLIPRVNCFSIARPQMITQTRQIMIASNNNSNKSNDWKRGTENPRK